MKKYMQPAIEELEVELEQMIADSISIVDGDATDTDGIYDDSRSIESLLGFPSLPNL
ncbi:MAG: hypothetical protein IJ533_07965 [Prevotella sp.]|nr:hypothetical protein [Prevotella sp.]